MSENGEIADLDELVGRCRGCVGEPEADRAQGFFVWGEVGNAGAGAQLGGFDVFVERGVQVIESRGEEIE